MFHRLVLVVMLFCGLGHATPQGEQPPAQPPQQDPQKPARPRQAPPGEAEQVRQRNYLDGIYDFSKRLGGKDKEDVRVLATLLLEDGQGAANTPAQTFMLLMLAREAAVKIGEAKVVDGAVAALGAQFFVDAATLKYESALAMTKNGQSGAKALDLLHMFVEAGLGCMANSPKTAQLALTEAELQCSRCAGTKDVHEQALKEVARLRDAMKATKLASERAGAGEVARVAVPPENDGGRVQTRTTLRVSYGDLDAKSKREITALLTTAMSEGMATKKHAPGARYEFLLAAKDLACRCGDTAALARTVDEMAVQFDIKAPATLLAGARDAVKRAVAPAQDLMRLLLDVARMHIASDPTLARQVLEEAVVQCNRLRGTKALHTELLAECKKVEAELDLSVELARLRDNVVAKPEDPAAAEQLGWVLCVRAERWQEGLPFLAKGTTKQLVLGTFANTIAKKELLPEVSDDAAWEIAEAWWSYADATDSRPEDRAALRRHAREWYAKLTHLKDVRRRKVEACLRDTPPPAAPTPPVSPPPAKEEPAKPKAPGGVLGAAKDEPVANAVGLALDWLAKHQDADGRWDCAGFMKHDTVGAKCDGRGGDVYDVGGTGLALLAFANAGITPEAGAHAEVVRRGLEWLGRQQQQGSGKFGLSTGNDAIYQHAIATKAMAHYAKATPGQAWTSMATLGLGYLLHHRNRGAAWRYNPQGGDNDLSVTAWCLAACRACQDMGLDVDEAVWREVAQYADQITDETGAHGYMQKGEPSARKPGEHAERFPPEKGAAMTAAGLYSRLLLGQKPSRTPVLTRAAALVAEKAPSRDPQAMDFYYWHHGTVALRKIGGESWSRWQRPLREAVIKPQRRDGNFAGSWDPVDCWGEDCGRVVATALLCLTLQAGFSEANDR
jgi:hypothetical protein